MSNNEKSNLYAAYKDFAVKVKALTDAWADLANAWAVCQDLEDEYKSNIETVDCCKEYPFDMSFDELYYEVLYWEEEVEDWVNNIAPQELGL